MQIIVFEDEQINRLFPITVGRPAYAMTCGSYRLIDWLAVLNTELSCSLRGIVRPHLMTIQQVDYPQFTAVPALGDGNTLLVNARLVPSVGTYETLKQLVAEGRSGTVRVGESIAAAFLSRESPQPPAHADVHKFLEFLHNPGLWKLPVIERQLPLLSWPHDLVRYNLEIISASLAHRIASGKYREIATGVFAAEGAVLGQYCTTDTSKGPVLLDENATVGPYSFLRGPAYLGPKAKVIEHSAIKDAVSLGHTTKIGGEVEASIVEPYTNKQHHGFLGHSYLGSWINLGAGTCNSDLKNTYGSVKMDYRGESVPTGMQFVGCMMGDYSKSAINTGIFTGKTVGCCSMLYGYVTTNVASFVNYARLFGQVTELPPDVMIATQQRMFARRNVQQRACDAQLINDMYELTRNERQLAGEPLQL
ncbi:putative sugar nucleotidyl transferase [Anatilimnocola floriformis]|uniref:putative sugar nucleotidyl transferase n=1 Tax=Anatilimnocola floriformis TaxID=2948575 RepID=UPI0020C290D8|nr:putative sugar nucleotidyl transferase [Anatilimnocola floriformis]